MSILKKFKEIKIKYISNVNQDYSKFWDGIYKKDQQPLFYNLFEDNVVQPKNISSFLAYIDDFYKKRNNISKDKYDNKSVHNELVNNQAYTHLKFIKKIINNDKQILFLLELGKKDENPENNKNLLGHVLDSFIQSDLLFSEAGINRFNECMTLIRKAVLKQENDHYLKNAFSFNHANLPKIDKNILYKKLLIILKNINECNKDLFNKVDDFSQSEKMKDFHLIFPVNFFSYEEYKNNYKQTLWNNCDIHIFKYAMINNFFSNENKKQIKDTLIRRGFISSIFLNSNYNELLDFLDFSKHYFQVDSVFSIIKEQLSQNEIFPHGYYFPQNKEQVELIDKEMDLEDEKNKLTLIFNQIHLLKDDSLFYKTWKRSFYFYKNFSSNDNITEIENFLINDISKILFISENKKEDIKQEIIMFNKNNLHNASLYEDFYHHLFKIMNTPERIKSIIPLLKKYFNEEELKNFNSFIWENKTIWGGDNNINKKLFYRTIYLSDEKELLSKNLKNRTEEHKSYKRL